MTVIARLKESMTDSFIFTLLEDLRLRDIDVACEEGREPIYPEESPELRVAVGSLIAEFVALHGSRIGFEAFKSDHFFNSDSPYRDAEEIASDLYLTLAGHGVGFFFDGGYTPEAETTFMSFCEPARRLQRDNLLYKLTAWVERVYVGDDGLVYPLI